MDEPVTPQGGDGASSTMRPRLHPPRRHLARPARPWSGPRSTGGSGSAGAQGHQAAWHSRDMDRPATDPPAPCPGRSGASTVQPRASNGARKASKAQPPQKAPWVMTTSASEAASPWACCRRRPYARSARRRAGIQAAALVRRGEGGESGGHRLACLPLERHDQLRRLGQVAPAPLRRTRAGGGRPGRSRARRRRSGRRTTPASAPPTPRPSFARHAGGGKS